MYDISLSKFKWILDDTNNDVQMQILSHSTSVNGPHLVGLVEEAAPASLQQELNVLINTAARELSGQIVSAFKNHTYTEPHKHRDQDMKKAIKIYLCQ